MKLQYVKQHGVFNSHVLIHEKQKWKDFTNEFVYYSYLFNNVYKDVTTQWHWNWPSKEKMQMEKPSNLKF